MCIDGVLLKTVVLTETCKDGELKNTVFISHTGRLLASHRGLYNSENTIISMQLQEMAGQAL
jgi:hypothetical protein